MKKAPKDRQVFTKQGHRYRLKIRTDRAKIRDGVFVEQFSMIELIQARYFLAHFKMIYEAAREVRLVKDQKNS